VADYNAPMNRHLRPFGLLLATTIGFALQLSIAGCGPSDPLDAIKQAQAEGRIEETVEPLRELIDERPGDAEVLFIYGRTLSSTGRAGLGEWSLREAMRDPDWMMSAGMQLALDSARAANYDSAISVATEMLEADPDSIPALTIRASSYAHSRMHNEEALADANRVLELDPENLEIMEAKILALLGLERVEEVGAAMEELGRKVDRNELGSSVAGWHCATTAIFAEESGDIPLADSRWVNCLEGNSSDPEMVLKAVRFYDGQGRFDRSEEIFRVALEANPNSRPIRVRLASRLRESQRVEEAESMLRAATESENISIAAASWMDLAKHFQSVERFADAAVAVGEAFALAESIESPDASMLLEYADALLIAGRYDESLALADRMVHEPHEQMIRARVAQERGNFKVALEHFARAFALWPDNPFARYYGALAAEALGNFDLALEQYKYSVRIAPGATDARIRAAKIYRAELRPGLAIQILRIKAHEEALEPEGEILSFELWALTNRARDLEVSLSKIRDAAPTYIGEALASVAKGIRFRADSAAAVASLNRAGGIDPEDLNYAEAIRALVEYGHESGELDGVSELMAKAQAAHPDAATLKEIAARDLELAGGSDDDVRAAFKSVLEVEPDNARALSGLGRLATKAGDHEEALAWFGQAASTSESETAASIDAARALLALGRASEAVERLVAVIEVVPFHAVASGLVVDQRLANGNSDETTLDYAMRAVRFGRTVEDLERLAKVFAARGDSEQADSTKERANDLRESQKATESQVETEGASLAS
jgi:tetratricopeptide (TPR) repeat protein